MALVCCKPVHAEENRTEVKVDFRVNDSHIDPGYHENAGKIMDIISFIDDLQCDTARRIVSVTFRGTASPEGPDKWNRHLAGARMASLEKLIRSHVRIPDSIIRRDAGYIHWEYLRQSLAASGHPYKDTVISIIDSRPGLLTDPDDRTQVDSRIVRLKRLDNRAVWNDLARRYFGRMRNAVAVIITYEDDIPSGPDAGAWSRGSLAVGAYPPSPSSGILVIPDSGRRKEPAVDMGIYTNLLYDAMAIPNLGAEFYLGKDWSIIGNWMYAWWNSDVSHRYWRVYGGDIGVRRWFGGRRVLTGHHVGIYGQMLTYDIEFGGTGYQGGRWTWGAGVSYGYSLPLCSHLNLDFTLGVGYARGEYKKYNPVDGCYVWDSTHVLNWFGPTKAEVSLVWYIGSGRKGGAR